MLKSYLFFLKTMLKIRQLMAKMIPTPASMVYKANRAGWMKFSLAARGVPSASEERKIILKLTQYWN